MSDVIHNAKCAARTMPILVIVSNVELGSCISSFLTFLDNSMIGIRSIVVNNNLYRAIDKRRGSA